MVVCNLLVFFFVNCVRFLFALLLFSVPPQISPFDFGEESLNADEMASVLCSVNKGDLPLNISWDLNGKLAYKIKGVSVLRTNKRISQLSIESVQAEHSGTYTCTASNSAGTVLQSAYLHINGNHLILVVCF